MRHDNLFLDVENPDDVKEVESDLLARLEALDWSTETEPVEKEEGEKLTLSEALTKVYFHVQEKI